MKRILLEQLKERIGEPVKIAGWVNTIRDQGSIKFILLRDISGIVQVVVSGDEKIGKKVEELTTESVIEITGVVKEEKQAPGGYEVIAEKIVILSKSVAPLPIAVVEKAGKEASQSKRLDWRWIDLRKPEKQLIFKVWTTMEQAFINFCTSQGYIRIHSPKMMSTPSESGSELFEVEYFGRKAYLAQSPQFYKQMGMAAGFEKVFEIGPVFRANPSFTSRHDTEFTGYDVEISFVESHEDVIVEEEKMLVAIIDAIVKKFGEEIERIYGRKLEIPKIPFPQITLREAKIILKDIGVKGEKPDDLSPEEERELSKYIREREGHEFVFVTEYPGTARPFYHMRKEEDKTLTKSYDLLWNGIEITTGAQREHRFDILIEQAKEKGLDLKSIQHYSNFFKYGCPPHGGFGLGPTRMLMKIFDIDNVREVTYLYRGVKRLEP
jgi:nondiscriminating aspartyl-tRNA synthetase